MPPIINDDFIIYSGTASPEFLKFRLGQDLYAPFINYKFSHPGTCWYNIPSRLGTRLYFKKNSPQIFDFFAQLIARRINAGKKILLIAKKMFIDYCKNEMQQKLCALGLHNVRVVDTGEEIDISDINIIPIINYGMIGINTFESYDCAYCLTGYYVNEDIINTILQDIVASDMYIPINIKTVGVPRRRKAEVLNYRDRVYDINYLAQMALDQMEMDTVIQAVGRVRPYTKPREIITFQCAGHPQLEYTEEFNSIAEARQFFDILSCRKLNQSDNRAKIQLGMREGLTQAETAAKLDLSIRTVKRYWRVNGDTNTI
ncbi:MAG: hypothetical protein ABIK15_05995 [Pseudomonadota bacterium]